MADERKLTDEEILTTGTGASRSSVRRRQTPTGTTRTTDTTTPTTPTPTLTRGPELASGASPAASSRSTRRSSSPSTGSSSRSPSRGPRRVASTTCSPSRTSSGWSAPAVCATPPSGSSRKAGMLGLSRVHDRPRLAAGRRSPGRADPDRVAAAFEDGATIVLQALHLNWPPLARFCRWLEAELGHPVQANSYYTPRRSQGFAVHHDTHDVFVLQVAGEKHWRVYDPLLELPLKQQRYSKALGEHGPPVLELTLRAGDTLYLPRGWLHDALTSETDSLHVTVGVNVHTWVDALRAALDECENDLEFRRSVREDGVARRRPARAARRAASAPDEVARRARARFVDSRRPILDGQLEEVRALDSLTVGHAARAARRP